MKKQLVAEEVLFLLCSSLLLSSTISISSNRHQHFDINGGKVIELDDSNFDSAISSFDFILVDFYAPWCGHCKRLSPQLDAAAPFLAELKEPIKIAKVDADKYRRIGNRYEIDGYPTLKLFMHGVPVDYFGPREPDLLVRFLKKFVAPNVAVLGSDTAISSFVEAAGTFFPIYIGFGMNESVIFKLANRYKKRAWFSVAENFSDGVMEFYDFRKVPALVSLQPTYDERSIFYGPFNDKFQEEFIRQNLFPLCLPLNSETLKLLRDEDRNIVLTIMQDETDEKSKQLVKVLKSAASSNRDFLFAYVGAQQYEEFVEPFDITKKTKLPKMVVWDGNEEYFTVIGYESIGEEDRGLEIKRFLEGYREGKTVSKKISGQTFIKYLNDTIGVRLIFVIVYLVIVLLICLTCGNREQNDARRPEGRDMYREELGLGKED